MEADRLPIKFRNFSTTWTVFRPPPAPARKKSSRNDAAGSTIGSAQVKKIADEELPSLTKDERRGYSAHRSSAAATAAADVAAMWTRSSSADLALCAIETLPQALRLRGKKGVFIKRADRGRRAREFQAERRYGGIEYER